MKAVWSRDVCQRWQQRSACDSEAAVMKRATCFQEMIATRKHRTLSPPPPPPCNNNPVLWCLQRILIHHKNLVLLMRLLYFFLFFLSHVLRRRWVHSAVGPYRGRYHRSCKLYTVWNCDVAAPRHLFSVAEINMQIQRQMSVSAAAECLFLTCPSTRLRSIKVLD